MIPGILKTGGKSVDISKGRLRGNEITFTAGSEVYNGIVNGTKIDGIITSGGINKKWRDAS
jgi:hypothetical protein